MKILIVVAHPRPSSLSHLVARAFCEAATANGHATEWADLVAEGFDPVLREADEPDWDDPAKRYSPEVQAEMARIERNEATVLVFPVYWWSMPAVLKGWIDRVWNNGWAYGDATYPHKKALMIALAGNDRAAYEKRGYDKAMTAQLDTGVLRYCGVEDARLEMLYGTLDGDAASARTLEDARRLGTDF